MRVKVVRPTSVPLGVVGVDLGIAAPVTRSDGRVFDVFGLTEGEEKRKVRLQQSIARRSKGSSNRRKAVAALSELEARGARRRRHLTHEATSSTVKSFGMIAVEDCDWRAMTASARGTVESPGRNVAAKSGLNRALLGANPGEVRRQLEWKSARLNRTFVKVDAAYTSQRCSACMRHPLDADAPRSSDGTAFAHGRLSQASFVCPLCGWRENADVNAAKVIRALGVSQASTGVAASARPRKASKSERKAARERLASERAARRAEKEKRREEAKAARAARVSAGSKSKRSSSKVVNAGWFPAVSKNPAEEMPVAAPETSALASRGTGKKFRGQAFESGGVPPPFLKV